MILAILLLLVITAVFVVPSIYIAAGRLTAEKRAFRTAECYAGPGMTYADVVRALGKPQRVYPDAKSIPFAHPVHNEVLRYSYGFGVSLYVFLDKRGRVEASLVHLT